MTPFEVLLGASRLGDDRRRFDTSILVHFSAEVSSASLGNSVTLRGATGAAVDGTLLVTGATATFTPSAPLPLACVENAQVAATATDTVAQTLGKAYRWQFTTADGAWGPEQSLSGATYTDGGVYYSAGSRVAIAADGSAFTSWTAYDPSGQHLYLHASRYTPAGGWAPHLQFDELLQDGRLRRREHASEPSARTARRSCSGRTRPSATQAPSCSRCDPSTTAPAGACRPRSRATPRRWRSAPTRTGTSSRPG